MKQLGILFSEVETLNPAVVYCDLVFLHDFGCFKKGEKLEGIELDLVNGEMTEHNDEGQVNRKVLFRLQPIQSIDYQGDVTGHG